MTDDDPGWVVPVAHIWAERKKPHVALDPAALQIHGQPQDRQPIIDAGVKACV